MFLLTLIPTRHHSGPSLLFVSHVIYLLAFWSVWDLQGACHDGIMSLVYPAVVLLGGLVGFTVGRVCFLPAEKLAFKAH